MNEFLGCVNFSKVFDFCNNKWFDEITVELSTTITGPKGKNSYQGIIKKAEGTALSFPTEVKGVVKGKQGWLSSYCF